MSGNSNQVSPLGKMHSPPSYDKVDIVDTEGGRCIFEDDRGAPVKFTSSSVPAISGPLKRGGSVFGRLATVAVSAMLGLVACELIMRVFPEFQVPVSDEQYLFCGAHKTRHQLHPLYGYTEIPGNIYFERFSQFEPWNFVRINAEGFRDNAPRTGKPVIVLGDSMVRGSLVKESETFTALLNTWHPELSFWNYGVGGYGQANSVRLYEDKGAGVDHRLVVQAVSLSTDLEDNAERATVTPDSVEINIAPANQHPAKPGSFMQMHIFLWNNSKLYSAVFASFLKPYFGNSHARRDMDNALEVTRRLLVRLAADAKSNHADLLVLVLPGWAEMAGRDDKMQPDRQRDVIRRFVAETPGTYVVDATSLLKREDASHTYGKVDKHLNPFGHFLVAEAVDQWLVNDWPGRPSGLSLKPRQFVGRPEITPDCAHLPSPGQ